MRATRSILAVASATLLTGALASAVVYGLAPRVQR